MKLCFGENGYLVGFDRDLLADKIYKLSNDRELTAKMGESGYGLAVAYSKGKILDEISSVYLGNNSYL